MDSLTVEKDIGKTTVSTEVLHKISPPDNLERSGCQQDGKF